MSDDTFDRDGLPSDPVMTDGRGKPQSNAGSIRAPSEKFLAEFDGAIDEAISAFAQTIYGVAYEQFASALAMVSIRAGEMPPTLDDVAYGVACAAERAMRSLLRDAGLVTPEQRDRAIATYFNNLISLRMPREQKQ